MVEEKLHVAISVKDFKAIIFHADSVKASIVARYTRPCRPLQISYEVDGMVCEFTLMTRGEAGEEVEAEPAARENINRELSARPAPRPAARAEPVPANRAASIAESEQAQLQPRSQSALPARTNEEARGNAPLPPSAPIDHDSLFVPADDDQQWDEPQYDNREEEEDMLRWDEHINQVSSFLTFILGSRVNNRVDTCLGDLATKPWWDYS